MIDEEMSGANVERREIKKAMLADIVRIAEDTQRKLLCTADVTMDDADAAIVETLASAFSVHVAMMVNSGRVDKKDIKKMTETVIDAACETYPQGGFAKKH